MAMKYDNMRDIGQRVEHEGLTYFLLDYMRPENIPDGASVSALEFRRLWIEVLPLLEKMRALLTEAGF